MKRGMWKLYMTRSIVAFTGVWGFSKIPVKVTCPITTNNILQPWSICNHVIFCLFMGGYIFSLNKTKLYSVYCMAEFFVEMNICLCQRVLGDYILEIILLSNKKDLIFLILFNATFIFSELSENIASLLTILLFSDLFNAFWLDS